MIPPDGLHGHEDYPDNLPVLRPQPRLLPPMQEVASDEDWHRARMLWRKLGWVKTPMPDGSVIPPDKPSPELAKTGVTPKPKPAPIPVPEAEPDEVGDVPF